MISIKFVARIKTPSDISRVERFEAGMREQEFMNDVLASHDRMRFKQ